MSRVVGQLLWCTPSTQSGQEVNRRRGQREIDKYRKLLCPITYILTSLNRI